MQKQKWVLPNWLADKITEARTKLPQWAPPIAVQEWEAECRTALRVPANLADDFMTSEIMDTEDPTRCGVMGLYYRLLSYPDMAQVWRKLPTCGITPDLFLNIVYRAFTSASTLQHSTKTPAQQAAWLKDVQSTARKLADLLQDTELDHYLRRRFQRQSLLAIAASSARRWVNQPSISAEDRKTIADSYSPRAPLSGLLRDMAKDAPTFSVFPAKPAKFEMATINGENAPLRYFVKSVTCEVVILCQEPLRAEVAFTAMAAYPEWTPKDNASAIRQVRRWAPVDPLTE